MNCNKCGSENLEVKRVLDFSFHKCKNCGNEQKIYLIAPERIMVDELNKNLKEYMETIPVLLSNCRCAITNIKGD